MKYIYIFGWNVKVQSVFASRVWLPKGIFGVAFTYDQARPKSYPLPENTGFPLMRITCPVWIPYTHTP